LAHGASPTKAGQQAQDSKFWAAAAITGSGIKEHFALVNNPNNKQQELMIDWYLHTHAKKPSRATFGCKRFRAIIQFLDKKARFPHHEDFTSSLRLRMDFFKFCYSLLKRETAEFHRGNPFVQGQHDGAHLSDAKHYQAAAEQFVHPGKDGRKPRNITACIAFRHLRSGTAQAVGDFLKSAVRDQGGLMTWWLDMVQDGAALATAGYLDFVEVLCEMHNLDKVPRWAVGLLKKKKSKKPLDPFDEGEAIVLIFLAIKTHFSYERISDLWTACKEAGCANVKFDGRIDSTRVAGIRDVLLPALRMSPGIRLYAARVPDATACQLSEPVWIAGAEFEAMCNTVAPFTFLVQAESACNGAYRVVLRHELEVALGPQAAVRLIDWHSPGTGGEPLRLPPREVRQLSDYGQTCFRRAKEELHAP
jgi:hypothetical protein